MRTSALWTGGLLGILLLCAGCGDGNSEPGGCEGLCNTLCRMATDCIQDVSQDECLFQVETSEGGTLLQGRNPAGRGCEVGMIRDVCGDTTKPAALFSACGAAVELSACAVVEDQDVLVLPDACKGLLDCNAGPCLD
jgi:hypothetical protein